MRRNGTAHSVGTAMKATSRKPASRRRELDRKMKRREKEKANQQAAHDVARHEALLERITSIHRECSERVDWAGMANRPAPVEPRKNPAEEQAARKALADYAPGRVAKIVGRDVSKRARLEAAIKAAVRKDSENFKTAHGRWLAEMEDWRRNSGLARRVLAGDPEARVEAVRRFGKFAQISEIGSNIVLRVLKTGSIEATLTGHGKAIVPADTLRQLKSGKLSVKKMPKGRTNELHRDHVCSCLIRAAREVLSLLPDDEVVVTIVETRTDEASGSRGSVPVLSASVVRERLESIDLENTAPSEIVKHFAHSMVFGKFKGLGALKSTGARQVSR